ncbi:UNVERIFIED_CONTAM: hypothetical protein H355_002682, partial [Colinus virginianus]
QNVFLCRLSQRSALLQQMESYLGDKKTKKTWQTQAADAARKRNAALLNDIEAAEKKLQERMYLLPHPDTVKLEVSPRTVFLFAVYQIFCSPSPPHMFLK